jgi:hypothetical protein
MHVRKRGGTGFAQEIATERGRTFLSRSGQSVSHEPFCSSVRQTNVSLSPDCRASLRDGNPQTQHALSQSACWFRGIERKVMFRSALKIGSFKEAVIAGAAMIVIGFAAYEIFESGLYQPQIAATGSVTAVSKSSPGLKVTAQTRLAIVGRRSFWQVEASPGVWKDCGSDCAAVLRQSAFRE